jgi:hypothetical protein
VRTTAQAGIVPVLVVQGMAVQMLGPREGLSAVGEATGELLLGVGEPHLEEVEVEEIEAGAMIHTKEGKGGELSLTYYMV